MEFFILATSIPQLAVGRLVALQAVFLKTQRAIL
jgi:hypothetical protein